MRKFEIKPIQSIRFYYYDFTIYQDTEFIFNDVLKERFGSHIHKIRNNIAILPIKAIKKGCQIS